MTDRKGSVYLRRLAEERGGTFQGDAPTSDETVFSKKYLGKKPKKKSLSVTNPDTKGTIVCVKENERVKYWKP